MMSVFHLHHVTHARVTRVISITIGSLSTRVFEKGTATGREHFACQGSGVSQIFILIISNRETILSNVNVVVWRQVKRENNSLPVAVRVSKTRVLKLPNEWRCHRSRGSVAWHRKKLHLRAGTCGGHWRETTSIDRFHLTSSLSKI